MIYRFRPRAVLNRIVAVAAMVAIWMPPSDGSEPTKPDVLSEANSEVLSPAARAGFQSAIEYAKSGQLAAGLNALSDPSSQLQRDLIRWAAYRAKTPEADFNDIRDLLLRRADWPSRHLLRRRAEQAISAEDGDMLYHWFERNPPLTGRGKIIYAGLLFDRNREDEAVSWLREGWHTADLQTDEQALFLRRYGTHLRQEDHIARVDWLLWVRNRLAASRLLNHLPSDRRALAVARMSLIAFAPTVDRDVSAVPKHQTANAGLVYDRVRWRRRHGKHQSARDLMLETKIEPTEIQRPDRWWWERHYQARRAFRRGQFAEAYGLAADHALFGAYDMNEIDTEELPRSLRGQIAEAEWLAGWIALRYLGRPAEALSHFERLYSVVQYPVSLSRAAYWAGRAADELGELALADHWYLQGAAFPLHFYGQLSLSELEIDAHLDATTPPIISESERQDFLAQSAVSAMRLLAVVRARPELHLFARHLASTADSEIDQYLASELGRELNRPDISVATAKVASRSGLTLVDQGYPVIEMPDDFADSRSTLLALTRQESAFDPAAISHAGAMGLMQLMPNTASRLARNLAFPYSRERLVNDPHYNLTLGGTYLTDLLARYDGSYILALSAYNAGERPVSRWIEFFGDPRSFSADPVDWIESIPFSETRNYVQRVLEAAPVYDARLRDGRMHTTVLNYLRAGQDPPPQGLRPQPKPR